jgi:hypothetical protein
MLRHNVVSQCRDDAVVGLTSIGNRLFILRSPNTQEIDVYDIRTGHQLTPLQVKELSGSGGAHGIASCVTSNCLYVSHSRKDTVYKIVLAADSSSQLVSWKLAGRPVSYCCM